MIEIQGHRQPESSGGTIFKWGTGEAMSKGPTAGVVRQGAASLPPHQLGDLGSAVSSPAGSGAELKVFLAFCATRLPLLALQCTLAAVCKLCELYASMIAKHFHDTRIFIWGNRTS